MFDYERYKPIKIWKLETSKVELSDIAKAWLAISLAFALSLAGGLSFGLELLVLVVVCAFTVGVGFLCHELMHKLVAQRYGCMAEFRAQDVMLLLMLGLSLFTGFIFAAPGAVMIAGRVTVRENGIISAAGPATNFVLALLFLALSFVLPLGSVWFYGFLINSWLGLFNLIPVWNLDGRKILDWHRGVYVAMVIVGVALVFGRQIVAVFA